MITISTNSNNQSYELLKIILNFVSAIAWPFAVVIIIFCFKGDIKKILTRAKKLELPGGFAIDTVDKDINQAKELSTEVEKERRPEIKKIISEVTPSFESEANKRMIQLGLTPSRSGLNIDYYKKIANTDPRLSLIVLRTDLEIMLENLAKGFNVSIGDKDSTSLIISKLLSNGSITLHQYELLNTLFRICNTAAHGVPITEEQAMDVLKIGEMLIKDYIAWLSWGFN